ncbi:MAG: hypothetical protein FH748_10380 [Balneolaceae bacterium]|nr:hypothetical protein [Balneolaceae bacterium]
MKNYYSVMKFFVVVMALSLVTVSCGDDPASGEDQDPPEIPSFEQIAPNLSYFDNNPGKMATTDNFYEAKGYAFGLASATMTTQLYQGFFTSAEQSEATFSNGQWVWEYTYSYEGASVSIKLTAQENNSEVSWAMYWSYNDGQGNSFEDYKMIEGKNALDGSSGSWTFNSLNPDTQTEEKFLVTTWVKTSETEIEITTDFYTDDGIQQYVYTQNGAEHTITYDAADASNDIIIYWNTDTQSGYYQVGSDSSNRLCWNSNFQDTSCS